VGPGSAEQREGRCTAEPGHEALVASLHKTGTKDYDRCKIKLSSSSRKLR
jgi:hypothetical protein